jgi:transcriptional regulator GlxA family with amidase domain
MSARTFARRFAEATGSTPRQWVINQRLLLAQRLLETTDLDIDHVAERSGFGTASALRAQFLRHLKTRPVAYRRSFRPA